LTTSEIITTSYGSAGGGSPSNLNTGNGQNLPVVASVLKYNNQNNIDLITCPNPPSTTWTPGYFNDTNYIGGDACLTPNNKLKTTLNLTAATFWSSSSPANVVLLTIVANNLAAPVVQDIAYSGETCVAGQTLPCTSPILASAYDSQSYIYQTEPAQTQYGIWSWHSTFANLNQVNNNQSDKLSQQQSYPDKTYNSGVNNLAVNYSDSGPGYGYYYYSYEYPSTCSTGGNDPTTYACEKSQQSSEQTTQEYKWWCNYTYSFSYTASLVRLNNTNISIPSLTPTSTQPGELIVNLQNYGAWTQEQAPNPGLFYANACLGALYNNFLVSTLCGPGYTYITSDGEISGQNPPETSGVRVYAGPSPTSAYTTVWCAGGLGCGYGNNVQEGEVQKAQLIYKNVSILPYFLYNISMPAISSTPVPTPNTISYLNLSFDLYSPTNFLNPFNSLDPYPLNTGSAFFANTTSPGGQSQLAAYPLNALSFVNPDPTGFGNPSPTLITALTSLNVISKTGLGVGGLISQGPIGKYGGGSIKSPAYITSAPNDYIYILNTTCISGIFSYCSNANVILYTARFIPLGQYNITNAQPDTLPPNSTEQQWRDEWENYWSNVTAEQSQNLYIVNVSVLSSVNNNPFNFFCGIIKQSCSSANNGNLAASAIATDDKGDVFVFGQVLGLGSIDTNTIGISERFTNATISLNTSIPAPVPQGTNLQTSEFAVTPGGQNLFVASPYSGNILVYDIGSISGGGSPAPQTFPYEGNISLSYSNPSNNMSISKYLSDGGPFLNQQIANAYAGYCQSSCNDTVSNHVPIAIAEYDGMLYVLDYWSFTVCNNPNGGCYNAPQSSILMLRAFQPDGAEIPINPYPYNDIETTNSQTAPATASGLAGGGSQSAGFVPYGWPIAANISIPGGGYETYCVASCDFTPSTEGATYNGFPPIGPQIPAYSLTPNPNDPNYQSGLINNYLRGDINKISMSSDFNGTDYLISNLTLNSFGKPLYTELLAFKPHLENYTTLSFASGSPYTCYVNTTLADAGSTCGVANAIASMHPPIEGVPSSFKFIESEGTPSIFLSIATSTFSSSSSGSGSSGQSEAANFLYGGQLPNGEGSSSEFPGITGKCPTSTCNESGTQPAVVEPITLNSVISGYVLVPYNATYSLQESWNNIQLHQSQISPVGSCSPNSFTYYNYYYQQISQYNYYYYSVPVTVNNLCQQAPPQPPSNACSNRPFIPNNPNTYGVSSYNPPTTLTTVFTYGKQNVTPSKTSGRIEGGPTYLRQAGTGAYYNANLSDAGNIMPPFVNYNIFTNRVFGEIYINQTFGTQSNVKQMLLPSSGGPYVLQALQNQTYQVATLTQTGGGGYNSGYEIQISTNQSSSQSPVGDIGVQSYPPSSGYYRKVTAPYVTVSPYLNYSPLSVSAVEPIELFDIYYLSTHQHDLLLNLTGNGYLQGYNRLIYTYVDRFNNTINMPFDVDFANITTINVSITTVPNVTHPNQTIVIINGTAGFNDSWEVGASKPFIPVPVGTPIYLYYDYNLNYYSPQYSSLALGNGPPTRSTVSELKPYLQHELECAFPYNALDAVGCTLAIPGDTNLQGSEANAQANFTTFATQFNQTGNLCSNESSSLLYHPVPNCNIYNSITAVETLDNGQGPVGMCVPSYPNGTGFLTSQIGLMDIARTTNGGNFSYKTTACGTGPQSITAKYYGYPYPEPQLFTETPLSLSAGSSEFSSAGAISQLQEYNYSYAPNATIKNFNIGIYQLDYGDINAVVTILIVISAACILLFVSRSSKHKAIRTRYRIGRMR
jgi:hypothetical protein